MFIQKIRNTKNDKKQENEKEEILQAQKLIKLRRNILYKKTSGKTDEVKKGRHKYETL